MTREAAFTSACGDQQEVMSELWSVGETEVRIESVVGLLTFRTNEKLKRRRRCWFWGQSVITKHFFIALNYGHCTDEKCR